MKAFPIYGDNQGSIFISSNPVQERRTKHIDIRYHYVRELVESKEIEILFVEGNNNPADMFTKNLSHVKFLKFREQLGLEFYWVTLQSAQCAIRAHSKGECWTRAVCPSDTYLEPYGVLL